MKTYFEEYFLALEANKPVGYFHPVEERLLMALAVVTESGL